MISSIDGIIKQYTVVNSSGKRIYLNLSQLFSLLEDIIQSNQMVQQFSIFPFYESEKPAFLEEFDFGGLYIECRQKVSSSEKKYFWSEQRFWSQPDSEYQLLNLYVTDDDLKHSQFLCQEGDVESFHQALKTYQVFLLERGLAQLQLWLKEQCHLRDADMLYGGLCFEVDCLEDK